MVDYPDEGFLGAAVGSETLLEHMINTVSGKVIMELFICSFFQNLGPRLVFNY